MKAMIYMYIHHSKCSFVYKSMQGACSVYIFSAVLLSSEILTMGMT